MNDDKKTAGEANIDNEYYLIQSLRKFNLTDKSLAKYLNKVFVKIISQNNPQDFHILIYGACWGRKNKNSSNTNNSVTDLNDSVFNKVPKNVEITLRNHYSSFKSDYIRSDLLTRKKYKYVKKLITKLLIILKWYIFFIKMNYYFLWQVHLIFLIVLI